MILSALSRVYKPVIGSLMLSLMSGCASYYSHFAMFPAENSSGEPRQVRLSWQSADYPGWWLTGDKATPVKVETQCSDRIWRLHDGDDANLASCGEGIRACGQPGKDLVAGTEEPATGEIRCVSINPTDPAARVAEVGDKLELLVSCTPSVVAEGQGSEALNFDYLRASSVPYTVYVRKVPRGSMQARLPEFDESVCDAE
ncbi:hypothetical protein KO499_02190 [Marinobacter sp. F3R08]|nr:hypothetical protein [Marinobacter sp. F3R08]